MRIEAARLALAALRGRPSAPPLARSLFGGPTREAPARVPMLRRVGGGYRHFDAGGPGGGRSGYAWWWDFARSASARRAIAVGGGAAFAAYVYTLEVVPVTGRWHNVALSREAERRLGARTFSQIQREARTKGALLPADHPQARRVRRVGMRVAGAVERLRKHEPSAGVRHLQDLDWEVRARARARGRGAARRAAD